MTGAAGTQPRPLRIAVVANTGWYLYNFRRSLIRALVADGHVLFAIGGDDEFSARLQAEGIEHRKVAFNGSGTQPLRELFTVLALRRAVARERIDVVLSYTPKGNIYSALALFGRRTRLIMNISGLGMAFASNGPLASVVRVLYRVALRKAVWVFFQNDEDKHQFAARRMIDAARVSRLPGSGVDLAAFQALAPPSAAADQPPGPLFLMVARLLWDKGVGEFVEAARQVKSRLPATRFRLLGALASDHRAGVPEEVLKAWVAAGIIEYPGAVDDVRPHLAAADCVVLPSVYREGVPRSLLEAAAMARPVITTDSIGCRDAVDDGVSGYLCRPRDADDLAHKMLRLIALDAASREAMGAAGRAKMVREFDERIVIDAYRRQIDALAAAYQGP